MRRRIAIVACSGLVFLAGLAVGKAQEAPHPAGGSTWQNLTETIRDIYVRGFSNGYVVGARDASGYAVVKFGAKLPAMTAAVRKDMDEGAAQFGSAGRALLSPQGPGVEVIVSTVSTFYSDYRNTPICQDKAILFSVASLAGNAASDQELAAARKAGAETGCK